MDPDKLLTSGVGLMAAGITGMLLAPIMLPAVLRTGRPVMKGAVKAGFIMAERGRETLAELAEMAEDMVAEIQSELRAEKAAAAGATTSQAPAPAAGEDVGE